MKGTWRLNLEGILDDDFVKSHDMAKYGRTHPFMPGIFLVSYSSTRLLALESFILTRLYEKTAFSVFVFKWATQS
jgi:hypothetical protein